MTAELEVHYHKSAEHVLCFWKMISMKIVTIMAFKPWSSRGRQQSDVKASTLLWDRTFILQHARSIIAIITIL
jgi:hypothetical protein